MKCMRTILLVFCLTLPLAASGQFRGMPRQHAPMFSASRSSNSVPFRNDGRFFGSPFGRPFGGSSFFWTPVCWASLRGFSFPLWPSFREVSVLFRVAVLCSSWVLFRLRRWLILRRRLLRPDADPGFPFRPSPGVCSPVSRLRWRFLRRTPASIRWGFIRRAAVADPDSPVRPSPGVCAPVSRLRWRFLRRTPASIRWGFIRRAAVMRCCPRGRRSQEQSW